MTCEKGKEGRQAGREENGVRGGAAEALDGGGLAVEGIGTLGREHWRGQAVR